jgi:hypothetical protein
MKYERYEAVRIADDLRWFEFISTGKRGDYLKQIVFQPMGASNLYQLVFGNIVAEDEIDDYSVNDNGDRNRILATIAEAVYMYTKRYPLRLIYFKGSTKQRTRLYRMAIGLNLEELSLTFDIYAEIENGVVPFCKNMEVDAFIIKRKLFDHPFTTI